LLKHPIQNDSKPLKLIQDTILFLLVLAYL
jgi:hypothetical protein